jgi:hypothetical protein
MGTTRVSTATIIVAGIGQWGHYDFRKILQSYLHVHQSSVFEKWAPSRFSSGQTNMDKYGIIQEISSVKAGMIQTYHVLWILGSLSPTGSPLFIGNMGASIAPNCSHYWIVESC